MVESLGLSQIRTDGDTQVRVSFSSELVTEYAEAMKRGDEFPAIDVFFDGETYWLADGFYRVAAARKTSRESIEANVHQGGQREALLYAVGANETHGLRRTNEDKRRAVHILLADKEWQGWSDREIARQTKTSQPFVTKLRHDYLQTLSDGPAGRDARRVRRGERTYTMDTSQIGATPVPRPRKDTPAERTKETEGADAGAQPVTARPTLAVVPQRETITSVAPPPAVPLAEVYLPTVEQEAPMDVPPTATLMTAWEQASSSERQEFVAAHRPTLLELLDIRTPQAPQLPVDIWPSSQTGIILQAILTTSTPLSPEDLGRVSGVDTRRLGRNLTRLCKAGHIVQTADGRYAARASSTA